MRSLSNYNDHTNGVVDDIGLLVYIFIFLFAVVIQITCCVTCPGEGLCAIGAIKIFLSIIKMATFVGPGGEVHVVHVIGFGLGIFLGVIWIVVGQCKIDDRRRIQREQEIAERIPTHCYPASNGDDYPVAIVVHHDNSCPPPNMALQRKIQQGSGNYHEINSARIVGDGSLERSSNRVEEESVNYSPRFSFAPVAESIEMTTIRGGARQLKQEQQQGMSSFDNEDNREQDENEIV